MKKLNEVMAALPPLEEHGELEKSLPYPCSEFADPPITLAEARAIDLGRDTAICRYHGGQFTHLCVDGNVYFCAIGKQCWRYTRQPSDFLRPLP